MTQLVQLQTVAQDLADHGFTVFAISNDPVEVLSDFSREHGIDYPLLSDADSAVIRSFGIMNQLIESDVGKSMRWHGIPYPGTYFLDAAGMVTDKDFHQHHARRASGVSVLARALRKPTSIDESTQVHQQVDDAKIAIGLSDPALKLELITQLIVDIDIAPSRHLYAPGAPEAFTPLSVEVHGEGLRVGAANWPAVEPLTMTELGQTYPTYNTNVRVEIPITVTSALIRLGHELPTSSIDVQVTVAYQACDATSCGLPQQHVIELTVPVERLVEPEGLGIYAKRVEALEDERGESVR